MPNHRVICSYCKSSVLSRDIGLHIIKNHKTELFVGSNLKDLHRDKYLNKPLCLTIEDTPYFFCLADNSCIKNEFNADKHFKPRKDAHREAVLKLREAFPQTNQTPDVSPPVALLTKKELNWLNEEYVELLSHLRKIEKKAIDAGLNHIDDTFDWSKKSILLFSKLGLIFNEDIIVEKYPNLFAELKEKEEVEEEVEEPEEQEKPPEPIPETEDGSKDIISFNEKEIVSHKQTQEKPTSTLPKTNFALAPRPQPSGIPQLKIISNTKSNQPRQS